jgi:hypothetical protein
VMPRRAGDLQSARVRSDPLGEVATVRREMGQCGMDLGGQTFLAYLVRFAEPGAAPAAVRRARADGWAAESYRESYREHSADVVRLCREGTATARDLDADREYVATFAAEQGGRWEAVALEQFGTDTYWDELAERYLQKRSAASRRVVVPAQAAG